MCRLSATTGTTTCCAYRVYKQRCLLLLRVPTWLAQGCGFDNALMLRRRRELEWFPACVCW